MRSAIFRSFAALVVLAACFVLPSRAAAQVAVRAQTIYTMAGDPIPDGVIVLRDGKVHEVGPASRVRVPQGFRVLEAAVATPGLIDAHTVIGMAGYLNIPHDQDQLDHSAPIQPELRAIDGFNIRERLVEWVRGLGVTTLHTGHGPGAVISGQTMVVKTWGDNVDEAVMVPRAMVAATLGPSSLESKPGKAPGTRAKALALLREELVKAQGYAKKRQIADESKRPARDLGLDVMVDVLGAKLPLLVTVHRSQDILTALRLAEEFKIKVVLDGCSEAYLVLDEIRAAKVPVIVHPTMQRAGGYRQVGSETENVSMETAAKLRAAGIPMAMQSGYESYVPKTRVVLFEAGVATAYGLSFNDALSAITIDAARILGVADRVGSLERGKDGDVALFDGNPFEYTTHCVGAIVNGQVASEEVR